MAKVKVTQLRSKIGWPPDQIGTLRALGLRRIGHTVTHDDSPSLRGMLFKIKHLVDVQEEA